MSRKTNKVFEIQRKFSDIPYGYIAKKFNTTERTARRWCSGHTKRPRNVSEETFIEALGGSFLHSRAKSWCSVAPWSKELLPLDDEAIANILRSIPVELAEDFAHPEISPEMITELANQVPSFDVTYFPEKDLVSFAYEKHGCKIQLLLHLNGRFIIRDGFLLDTISEKVEKVIFESESFLDCCDDLYLIDLFNPSRTKYIMNTTLLPKN